MFKTWVPIQLHYTSQSLQHPKLVSSWIPGFLATSGLPHLPPPHFRSSVRLGRRVRSLVGGPPAPPPPLEMGCLTRNLWEPSWEKSRYKINQLRWCHTVSPYSLTISFHLELIWLWEQSLGLLHLPKLCLAWECAFCLPWVIS